MREDVGQAFQPDSDELPCGHGDGTLEDSQRISRTFDDAGSPSTRRSLFSRSFSAAGSRNRAAVTESAGDPISGISRTFDDAGRASPGSVVAAALIRRR